MFDQQQMYKTSQCITAQYKKNHIDVKETASDNKYDLTPVFAIQQQ